MIDGHNSPGRPAGGNMMDQRLMMEESWITQDAALVSDVVVGA
jgi:hypothetical protein